MKTLVPFCLLCLCAALVEPVSAAVKPGASKYLPALSDIVVPELKINRATPADALKLWADAVKRAHPRKKPVSYELLTVGDKLKVTKTVYISLDLKETDAIAALNAIIAEVNKSEVFDMSLERDRTVTSSAGGQVSVASVMQILLKAK